MNKNDFITIPTQKDIEDYLTFSGKPSCPTLNATAFAQHTGLTTVYELFPDNTAVVTETWLRNKGDHDTVMVNQADTKGRHDFASREVDDATVGVMPCLLNVDDQPFRTAMDQIGQTVLTLNNGIFRYPQTAATTEAAAYLDRNLIPTDDRHPEVIGIKQVGTYTAPDTGRVMPCYRWRGDYYVQHTNQDGHTAWFRCDPVAVVPLPNNKLVARNALFAAPFSSRQKFRERTQGVMADDELNLAKFGLGRFLADTFLPELIKSTTFGLTYPVDKIAFTDRKLSRLNVTLRNTETDQDLTR